MLPPGVRVRHFLLHRRSSTEVQVCSSAAARWMRSGRYHVFPVPHTTFFPSRLVKHCRRTRRIQHDVDGHGDPIENGNDENASSRDGAARWPAAAAISIPREPPAAQIHADMDATKQIPSEDILHPVRRRLGPPAPASKTNYATATGAPTACAAGAALATSAAAFPCG